VIEVETRSGSARRIRTTSFVTFPDFKFYPAWNEAVIFLYRWRDDRAMTLVHPGKLELEFENPPSVRFLSPTVN
jgi:hypothetical protein